MANENNAKEYSKLVSWFLNRKALFKREGKILDAKDLA